MTCILFTKIAAAQNEVALSYCSIRGLCFLAVIFAMAIVLFVSGEGNNMFY